MSEMTPQRPATEDAGDPLARVGAAMSGEKQGGCGCETCRNGDDQWCCESCHSLAKQMSPTPVPSEVAETTASEREVEAVEALAKVVVRAFGVRPMAAEERREIARAVLASDWLAALLDRVRREEGERIAQAIEDLPAYYVQSPSGSGWLQAVRTHEAVDVARAASVGRGEGP